MTDLKEEIRRAYEAGEGTFQELSEKYNVKISTIKSWAKRDKDKGNQWSKVATKQKTKSGKVVSKSEEILWIDIENEYVTDTRRKPCSLEDLSKKYNIPLQTIFDYSASHEWSFKRREYKEITNEKVKAKLVEHSWMKKRKKYEKTVKGKVNWELIRNEYLKSVEVISLKDLAAKFGVNDSTLRSRKKREKWDDELNNDVATQGRRDASEKQQVNYERVAINVEVIRELDNPTLTHKQRLFCNYYINHFNAIKAAIEAGYSKDIVVQMGYQLLQKPSIIEEINRLRKDIIQNIRTEIMDVLQEYIKMNTR